VVNNLSSRELISALAIIDLDEINNPYLMTVFNLFGSSTKVSCWYLFCSSVRI